MCPTCAPPQHPLRAFADLPTEELVAAACEGASQAWAEIVLRYERLVLGVVGSFRLQEADAADAAANTWLRAMEGLSALRDPDRLGGWLRTIARRECLGVLRQPRKLARKIRLNLVDAIGQATKALQFGSAARTAPALA